jgi:alpha-L-rhamnosidase
MLTRRAMLASIALPWAPLPSFAIDWTRERWRAKWVSPPGIEGSAYGVFHFRHTFALDAVPAEFVVNVSADSRYQLFVNGVRVSLGPARGDLYHWRYETVNIAPQLKAGANVLAAVVWNDGPHAAIAQWSNRTAFLLQATDAKNNTVNTGDGEWRVKRNDAYQPIPVPTYQPTGYYAIGPCEKFDASRYPWGWEQPGFDDAEWARAEGSLNASGRDSSDAPTRWMLVPRSIPMAELTPERLEKVRKAEGVSVPAEFPARAARFEIPPNTKAVVLLDRGHLTCAYPELDFSGGRGAQITLRYTEALFQTFKPRKLKGNRNEVEGKEFHGYGDTILADGGRHTWRPLFWRTYRYLQLTIETGGEALAIEDLRGVYTGYPFVKTAKFEDGDPLHQQMVEIGWRTARLCAHETYMDCPYYEQLQYAGDTRIQSLVSLYMTGDGRLMRNAIDLLDSSRTSEGATYSRAPSVLQQYIPPFSLWWIGMVHDYFWYVNDPDFVRQMLPGVRSVLNFYGRYQGADGMLRAMPWWNYVDWVEKWKDGRPPCEADMMPAVIHLQLLLAWQWAAGLETHLGETMVAARAQNRAAQLKALIQKTFWDAGRSMYAEDRAHTEFSQHANALAVLAGLIEGEAARGLMERVEADKSLYPCSVYFRYYLDEAMAKAGLGDRYLERLDPWKFMLKEGLTTWAEQDSIYTRSDCHAWGASPNVAFLRRVLGVDSAAPGFASVSIDPHLGALRRASGVIPHPKGQIEIEYDGDAAPRVKLPPGVTGTLRWKGQTKTL